MNKTSLSAKIFFLSGESPSLHVKTRKPARGIPYAENPFTRGVRKSDLGRDGWKCNLPNVSAEVSRGPAEIPEERGEEVRSKNNLEIELEEQDKQSNTNTSESYSKETCTDADKLILRFLDRESNCGSSTKPRDLSLLLLVLNGFSIVQAI